MATYEYPRDVVELGQRLKKERERLGLTQAAMAKAGGVTRATQFMYEQGDRSPNAGYLLNVIQGGVDPFYLFVGKEPVSPDQSISAVQMDVLSETLQIIAGKAREHRGNKMLSPANLISLIQILATRMCGKHIDEIDWNVLNTQIDGWFE